MTTTLILSDASWQSTASANAAESAGGNRRLVLNMAECDALNSIAIGVLMKGYASYRNKDGEIKLCGLGKRIKDLFTMTKLIMVFDHHETEEEAIAAFAGNAG